MSDPPREVLAAYSIDPASVAPIPIGLINRTFRATAAGQRIVLQRLHAIFAGEVNLDIDAITSHLASQGLVTPRLVRAVDGRPFVEHDGAVWRALTEIEGSTHDAIRDPSEAREAGTLVGRFHRALEHFDHVFRFTRAGVHETAAHFARLERALDAAAPDVRSVGDAILEHARTLDPLPTTRLRIVHGDLKISNVLFDGGRAIALCDLDTLAHGPVAHEMGDAMRSWCNPGGESEEAARLDPAIFAAAMQGWGDRMRGVLDQGEIGSIALGTETIAIELASRFATDAVEDRYFGWDPSRFPSRPAHNVVRARSQLSVARSVRSQRIVLEATVRGALG